MIQDIAPSERIIIIRPSLKKMCDENACRAAVLNHMLYWIAYKHKNGEDYWYATGEDLYTQMDASWSINIIRREVKALIASGLIGEMHNPKWAADRTKHFFFGQDQAKAFFTACIENNTCPWCIGFPTVILHLLSTHLTNLLNANDKSVNCICQKHQMHLLNLLNGTNRSGTAITKESTKETTKTILREISEEKEVSLVASAHAESDGESAFLSSLSQFEETLQEVHNGKAPRDVSSSWGEEGRSHEEPLKSADTSKEPACTSAEHDTTHEEETLQEKTPEVALLPTIQDVPTKPVPTRETHKQDELKIRRKIKECSPEIQARRRKWQAYFNQRRGGELLPLKGDRINESNAIASLVDTYTDAQIQAIDDQLFTVDKYWSDRERRHDIGGHIVWKKSTSVREVLKERYKWPGQVIIPQEEPKVITWTPVMRVTPPKGVTVIYG